MYTESRIPALRCISSFVRLSTGVLVLACLLAVGCTGDPADTALLPAQQTNPERNPSAAAVEVNVFNDSEYSARVQVHLYIGNTLVHHCEALLGPLSSGDLANRLLLDLEEADRVVITCRIDGSDGTALWSDQQTYMMGTDFADLDTVTYSIVYPPAGNQAPVANAGHVPPAVVGNTVTLDGSASSDSDNDSLTYQWSQLNSPPDPAVTLAPGPYPWVVTFVVPDTITASRILTFQLIVNDGQASSAPATVSVDVIPAGPVNNPPVAFPSGRSSGVVGDTIMLDGSGSSDPDGDLLSYRWVQLNVGVDPPVTLVSGPDPWMTSFVVPDTIVSSQTLTFQLIVNDGMIDSAPAVLTVGVGPVVLPVQAIPSAPFFIAADSTATLDASASLGPITSYHWARVSGPFVFLSPDPDQPVVTFMGPSTGGWMEFELTVSDGVNSHSARISVYGVSLGAYGPPPVVVAGFPSIRVAGETVGLRASGSFDPQGDVLYFVWRQTSGPAVTLSSTVAADVTFTAPYVSTETFLTFEVLAIVNGTGVAAIAPYVVLIEPATYSGNHAPYLATTTSADEVYEGWPVDLTSSASDVDADALTLTWYQVFGSDVTAYWSSTATSGPGYATSDHSFDAPTGVEQTTCVLKFLVTAEDNDSTWPGVDIVPVTVVVRLLGDVNGDGMVDSGDQSLMAAAMGSQPGSGNWNPWADLDRSGVVDSADATTLSDNLGRNLWPQ